jgi:hypothetical protein
MVLYTRWSAGGGEQIERNGHRRHTADGTTACASSADAGGDWRRSTASRRRRLPRTSPSLAM